MNRTIEICCQCSFYPHTTERDRESESALVTIFLLTLQFWCACVCVCGVSSKLLENSPLQEHTWRSTHEHVHTRWCENTCYTITAVLFFLNPETDRWWWVMTEVNLVFDWWLKHLKYIIISMSRCCVFTWYQSEFFFSFFLIKHDSEDVCTPGDHVLHTLPWFTHSSHLWQSGKKACVIT